MRALLLLVAFASCQVTLVSSSAPENRKHVGYRVTAQLPWASNRLREGNVWNAQHLSLQRAVKRRLNTTNATTNSTTNSTTNATNNATNATSNATNVSVSVVNATNISNRTNVSITQSISQSTNISNVSSPAAARANSSNENSSAFWVICTIALSIMLVLSWCLFCMYAYVNKRPPRLLKVNADQIVTVPQNQDSSQTVVDCRVVECHETRPEEENALPVYGRLSPHPGETWFSYFDLLDSNMSKWNELSDQISSFSESRVFIRMQGTDIFPKDVPGPYALSPREHAERFGIQLGPHPISHWACFDRHRAHHFRKFLSFFMKYLIEQGRPPRARSGCFIVEPDRIAPGPIYSKDLCSWKDSASPPIELPAVEALLAMESAAGEGRAAEIRSRSCPPSKMSIRSSS